MKTTKLNVTWLHALTAAISAGLCQLAHGEIEEVVVTAQKRAESAQEVPISIQAFSGESLSEIGISDTDDLGLATPGLQMNQGGVANLPFIRGIGSQDATPAQDTSVTTYVDGVLQSSVTGSAVMFNNVERIEVLKGPQGTLFGRNTTGGVINIITKDPTQQSALSMGASYGNYDTASIDFYGTTGISKTIAADLAVSLSDQGKGYSHSLPSGNEVNKREDEVNIRSKWKYVGDTFDATFIANYNEYSDDMGYVRGAPPGTIDLGGETTPNDEWDIRNDTEAYADFENIGASLKLVKTFDFMDVVSITAWNRNELDSFTDNDYAAVYWNNAEVDFFEETTTQEFQFLSNNAESRLKWIGGLFLLDQEAWGRYTIIGPGLGPGLNTLQLNGSIDTSSIAGFGEVAWNFTPQTRLTAGVRWTRDEREFSSDPGLVIGLGGVADANEGFFTGGGPVMVVPLEDADKSWTEPTYRVVVDHRLSDAVMLYASYNHGFRSGNFITATASTPAPFDPEFVDAYEVGIKSELLDNTLRLNAAAYFYDVEDLQFQILQGTTTTTVNAAQAEIKGFEFDLTWMPVRELSLMLGASYVDGEYTDFSNALSNTPCVVGTCTPGSPNFGIRGNEPVEAVIDASGNPIGGTPEWTFSGAATYIKETIRGEWSLALRATYNDGYPWEPDGRLRQDNYTIVNASAGWRSPSKAWAVRLNAKNLLDEFYSVSTRSTTVVGDFHAPGEPLTYFVTVEYHLE